MTEIKGTVYKRDTGVGRDAAEHPFISRCDQGSPCFWIVSAYDSEDALNKLDKHTAQSHG